MGRFPEYKADSGLDQYLREVSKHELLTREEEINLGYRIRDHGDQEAMDRMARSNLRFVISVAKKYQHRGVSLVDLINSGNLGLVRAVKKFDPDEGVKFVSYAVWWIRQAMLEEIARQGRAVRLPLNRASDLGNLERERLALQRKNPKLSDDEAYQQAGEKLKLSEETVEVLRGINMRDISLDAPVEGKDKSGSSIGERFHYESENVEDLVYGTLQREVIDESLGYLSERDQRVLRLYFGLDGEAMTLEEVGNVLGVTRERIRQLRDRALKRLREHPVAGVKLEQIARYG